MSTTIIDDDVKLNVFIEGDDPRSQTICITISRSATFENLAIAIQSAYRKKQGRDIYSLTLFKFDLPDGALEDFRPSDEIRFRSKVSSVWPAGSSINRELIHIIVRHQSRSSYPLLQHSGTKQSASPPDDELHELTNKFERAQLDFIQSLASPSSARATQITNFRKQQATSNYIRNGRPAAHTRLPIVLYHPVFGQFLSDLQSTDPIPPATYVLTTEYLIISQRIYNTEKRESRDQSGQGEQPNARDQTSRSKLSKLLGGFLSKPSAPGTQPDVSGAGHDGACIIVMEMMNEIGARGSDPSIQAAQSYSRYWSSTKEVRSLLDECCCPSILVAIAGPWMAILGAVFLDRPVVQPLTHLLWVGHDPARPSQLEYVTRVFHCVSLARERLLEFYLNVPVPHSPFDRFCPYVTHYTDLSGHQVEFTYLRALSDTYPANGKLVFLAETRNVDQPRQIVVKFVQTYNAEAHDLLAQERLAPALLYNGFAHPQDQPGPDHVMIVMEFLLGTDLSKFNAYPLPSCVSEDIDKALGHLHAHEFVFGDLRDPNVMIMMDSRGAVTGARLIDFDWCGEHQVGRYPIVMNPDIVWAKGVGPRELMDKNHDIEMRGKLYLVA